MHAMEEEKVPEVDPKHIAPRVGEHVVFLKNVCIIQTFIQIYN